MLRDSCLAPMAGSVYLRESTPKANRKHAADQKKRNKQDRVQQAQVFCNTCVETQTGRDYKRADQNEGLHTNRHQASNNQSC